MDQKDLPQLPEIVQRLVGLVGLLDTMLLVDKHAGQRFRLYESGEGMNRLAATIGREAADKVQQSFGIDEFEIPTCAALIRGARNARIQAEFDRLTGSGVSAREAVHQLSLAYGPIRERTVWRILKQTSSPVARPKRPVDERQLSLLEFAS
jgi:hypothetical protein